MCVENVIYPPCQNEFGTMFHFYELMYKIPFLSLKYVRETRDTIKQKTINLYTINI